jgi:hypothetical protein
MKIKPNVGNDDNGCNDGNGSESLGLKFFVVGKQTYDFCSEFFVHMY